MKRIGFIGLGIMGRAMCRNLIKAGFELSVYNRTRSRTEEAAAMGARVADSPADCARDAELVITIVTDTPDVREVLFGKGGVAETIQPGSIVADMSTISPKATREMAGQMQQRGVFMLDAPVSGGEKGAIEGTLSIMVGGDEGAFQRALPAFQAMGKKIVHVGPSGMGQTVKLCNQIAGALNLLAMSEALAFGARMGVDLEKMIEAVGAGAASSWAIVNLAPRVLKRDFAPGFMVKLQQKDLRLALEAAAEEDLPLPGTALVSQLFRAVEADGNGDLGTQALVLALEKLGKITVGG
ncbi:MAG: NAD(P)-dependent oxidoreductase [Armatimonadota bacterium]